MKKGALHTSAISSLLYKNKVSRDELLTEILADGVFGFAVVNIVPTAKVKRFLRLNWLPIIRHDTIQHDDLPDFMKDQTAPAGFPRSTVVQSIYGKEILLYTRLIQWYVRNGFKITRIHKMFEYQKYPCYKKVYDQVYQARVQATVEGNEQKATAIKLVSKSMFGQMIMVSLNLIIYEIYRKYRKYLFY